MPGKILHSRCSTGSGRNKAMKKSLAPLFGKYKAQSHRDIDASHKGETNHHEIKHSSSFDIDATVSDDSPIVPLSIPSILPSQQERINSGDRTLFLSENSSTKQLYILKLLLHKKRK